MCLLKSQFCSHLRHHLGNERFYRLRFDKHLDGHTVKQLQSTLPALFSTFALLPHKFGQQSHVEMPADESPIDLQYEEYALRPPGACADVELCQRQSSIAYFPCRLLGKEKKPSS